MTTECDKNNAFLKLTVLNSKMNDHWRKKTVRNNELIEVKRSKTDDQIRGFRRSELTVGETG